MSVDVRAIVLAVCVGMGCGGSSDTSHDAAPKAHTKAEMPKKAEPAKPAAPPVPEKPAEPDFASLAPEAQAAKLMELGKTVYETGGSGGVACITCHQANGKGLPPAFPPLAGAKDHMGDCATHAGIVIKGLSGEIEVLGTKYNGVMPPQGNLSDLEIAAVISYERNSWGNDYGNCTPDQVKAAR